MKTGFFQEAPGVNSIIRLGYAVMTVYAMVMAAWVFAKTGDYAGTIATFSAIETIAVGGKLIQKSQENQTTNKTETP